MASTATMMFRAAARFPVSRVCRVNARSVGASRFMSTVKFTESHEYAEVDGKIATIGITPHAMNAMGEIVFIDFPEVDDEVEFGEAFGTIESVKAAEDLKSPVSGTVVEINDGLEDKLETLASAPKEETWFIKVEMSDESELDDLMTMEEYNTYIEEE